MMDSKQVTQEQYQAVTGENPTLHPGNLQRPIDNVTWFDAVVYCNALTVRDGLEPVYTYKSVKGDAKSGVKDLPGIAIDIKKNGYRLLTSAEYEYVTLRRHDDDVLLGNRRREGRGQVEGLRLVRIERHGQAHPSRRHAEAQQVRGLRHHG